MYTYPEFTVHSINSSFKCRSKVRKIHVVPELKAKFFESISKLKGGFLPCAAEKTCFFLKLFFEKFFEINIGNFFQL